MKSFVTILALLMVLTSCQDILIEAPKSLAVQTFYNTADEVDGAVAAIYSPLRNGNGFGAVYISMLETSTDYHVGRASWAPPSEFQGLDGTNITRVGTVWNNFYLSIRNANLVIKNAPNGKNLSEADKNKFVGEAKFLRALTYFHLVRNWGGVILRTETNMEEQNLGRSSVEDVYKLITEDLQFAELHLPDAVSVAGRATKWAAKSLLADVYFYLGNHSQASSKANEVILSGKHSLIEVAKSDDFLKIFGADVVSTPEEIFYFKYSQEQSWAYPLYTNGVGTPYLLQAGYMALYSTLEQSVYASWDDKDLRKSYNWYQWSFGLGDNTILNKKFSDPSNLQPRTDYPLYRYADVLLLFAEASCEAAGNPTAEGLEALNKIRRRAYGYNTQQPSVVDYKLTDYTKESFIELVRKERGYETQAEGKRWLDLKRTGKPSDYIKAATTKSIAEKHYLWPLPVSELNYNSALNPTADQNPGY